MRWQVTLAAAMTLACGIVGGAEACQPPPPPPLRPGETVEQAWLRQERTSQAALWDQADVVVLARVVAFQDVSGDVATRLDVVTGVKGGEAPTDFPTALPPTSCRPNPPAGSIVLAYAVRDTTLADPRFDVLRILPVDDVTDDRVPVALREAAKRLRAPRP
ncbi:MAG: hypothetical protein K9G59_07220 [Caulobacter sp.]|nr:hypothetical protein [Caulobacter sp.]